MSKKSTLLLASIFAISMTSGVIAQTHNHASSSVKVAAKPKAFKPSLKKGKLVYKKNCLMCHGAKGKGDGPAGKALKARDFSKGKFKYGSKDADLIKIIKKGKGSMPAYKKMSDKDLKNVIHYIRSLGPNKVKGRILLPSG